MPSLPISGLTAGNPAQSADLLPMERAGVTYNVTAGSIAALASGGVGPGATGALPVFTSATTIGSSAATDDGVTLTYSGSTFALKTGGTIAPPDGVTHAGYPLLIKASAGSSGLGGGNETLQAGDSSGGGAGGALSLRAGNTSGGTSQGGSVQVAGGSGIFGGQVTIVGGAGVTAAAGDVTVKGGLSTSGTNGVVRLGIGANSPSITNNGAIAVHGNNSNGDATVFYPAVCAFANLSTPFPNPFNGGVNNKDGAVVFCVDAKGPQDGSTWGSTAAGSGTGGLLRYVTAAAHWILIG